MKKKNENKHWIVTGIVVIAIIAIAVGAWMLTREKPRADVDKGTKTEDQVKSTTRFDDGRLELVGSLEYEGPNFEDPSMEMNMYTMLKIKNISKSFLRNAVIDVSVNGSEKMQIQIDSLPAGQTVMAIGHGYHAFSEEDIYQVASCKSEYEKEVVFEKEGLAISFENGMIQVQNQSTEEYSNLKIRYKGTIGEELMGGNTYELTVENLAPGTSYEAESQSFLAESIQVVEVK